MNQDDMSPSVGSSGDSFPEPPKPMAELSNSKQAVKNFSRTNPSDTAHSPSKPDRISKHVTFLDTPINHIIPSTHDQTSQFLPNNLQESSTNHPSRTSETNNNPEVPEDSLEENPPHLTIYTSYSTTRNLFLKSTIDWNGLAKAHRTPEIETISTFLNHHEHYPHLHPDKTLPFLQTNNGSSQSESDTFKTFFNALEKSFPQYDFETLQRAIDIMALEQGKTATNSAPSFILLYALLAQIWHAGATMRDAWMKFQHVGFVMSFGNFSILMRQAEVFKLGDGSERNVLLLTESFCEIAEREMQMHQDRECEEELSSQLAEMFSTVLPHIYFGARGWSRALEIFNLHLGVKLSLRRFKKYVVPVVAGRMRAHDERHTARIRRVLKKEAVRTGVEITPETFCGVFNGMTGFELEEVVLRDVQNYLLGSWRV
ncbi:hypothetical protein BELL_0240g00120 [Botrytis elliptica]|uniref:Uncharacterized protein n=1 Tax=Botrytis elliptica TaxID=278938 RepID=A0A4Z1JMP7_9HELO|nr:hypothetical protein EAE99_006524 [Botrytis elliptica]TGO75019.1 hypothetical protein BELL_0240g00120 [Botrytis elliptica]